LGELEQAPHSLCLCAVLIRRKNRKIAHAVNSAQCMKNYTLMSLPTSHRC